MVFILLGDKNLQHQDPLEFGIFSKIFLFTIVVMKVFCCSGREH